MWKRAAMAWPRASGVGRLGSWSSRLRTRSSRLGWARPMCSCGFRSWGRSFSLLRGPRDDPRRVRVQRFEVLRADRGAPAHLPRPAGAAARWGSAQGAVAGSGDPRTGEIAPLAVVTDNGPAMKSVATARWFAARAHLTHVRTRHRPPHTNGVVERWINTLKYEHLYRHDIASGVELADRLAAFIDEYNTVRPHQALGQTPPLTAYPQDRTLKPNPPRNEQET